MELFQWATQIHSKTTAVRKRSSSSPYFGIPTGNGCSTQITESLASTWKHSRGLPRSLRSRMRSRMAKVSTSISNRMASHSDRTSAFPSALREIRNRKSRFPNTVTIPFPTNPAGSSPSETAWTIASLRKDQTSLTKQPEALAPGCFSFLVSLKES